MVKTAEAKCYFVTRKEELGYFLDTFMGAALYFCLVFDEREKKSTETFCNFFSNVLLSVLFCFVFEERSGTICCRKSNWTFSFGY